MQKYFSNFSAENYERVSDGELSPTLQKIMYTVQQLFRPTLVFRELSEASYDYDILVN